jgi:hypothetical protein
LWERDAETRFNACFLGGFYCRACAWYFYGSPSMTFVLMTIVFIECENRPLGLCRANKKESLTMKTKILSLVSVFALSACATIVGSTSQPVTFKTSPEGAAFSIVNRAGEKVHSGTTPATITLKKGAGYFKAESYTVRYEMPGYEPKEFVVAGNVNGWYFGNIIFGGVIIGMLIVDPSTGAMFTLNDEVANQTLTPTSVKTSSLDESLKIVTVDAVDPSVLAKARRIN